MRRCAELDEVGPLDRALREEHAVVGHDADRVAVDAGEAAVTSVVAVARLELLEAAAVDDPGDHLADVVGTCGTSLGQDAVELVGGRRPDPPARARRRGRSVLVRLRLPTISPTRSRARAIVVLREVVGDSRQPRVHVGAAELLGRHLLAGRRLHQRRAAEEDGAGVLHDDRFIAHRRDVGAARGARAHHHRDLRDAGRAHPRLVVEDPPEVVAVGEDLVLQRQERAAGVDQVDARQAVLLGDLLGADVLLHRHRVVGAPLDRRVVGDDQALPIADPADAGDHARARRVVFVKTVGGEGRQLQERRAGVEQPIDAVADEQLVLVAVPLMGLLAASFTGDLHPLAQVGRELAVERVVHREARVVAPDLGLDSLHGAPLRAIGTPRERPR